MKVFLNPGHAPNGIPDPGAKNTETGLRECDVAKNIADLVEKYLVAAGVDVVGNIQSDNLFYDSDYPQPCVCAKANASGADIFVSIHCNAFDCEAHGTETYAYAPGGEGEKLAGCINDQVVRSLGTLDRGVKFRDDYIVLKHTDMTAVLVETAFIDSDTDEPLLRERQDDFARAIARGITDYEQSL